MQTGKCPEHNCEYTGFGTLVFCPKCEESGKARASEGYFTDFMGEKLILAGNASSVLLYKDLEDAKKTAQDLVEDYAKFADSNIQLEIYKVKRNDLHDIQFSDRDLGGDLTSEVIAGFPGCTGHSNSNNSFDVTKIPRATIEVSPIVIITPAVV